MYFQLEGKLPWQSLLGKEATQDERYEAIKQKKLEVTLEELCKDQPEEFLEFMTYARKIKFDEKPDYDYLISIFVKCMEKHDINPHEAIF